jgi:hypothetical protein
MPAYINHPKAVDENKHHTRWNYVDRAVLARQIELLGSAFEGFDLTQEQACDVEGIKRLLDTLQIELRIEGNVSLYTYEG